MGAVNYNLQFEQLSENLRLGEKVGVPKAVSGGLLHRMHDLETTQGRYAVKALNPQIMLRPVAMQNFINSELITEIASNSIPCLPAKKFNGTSVQEIDGQFYLVFDWLDGRGLKANEISIVHCEKMGSILAGIHMIDFSGLGIVNSWTENAQMTDWNYYLQKGVESNSIWVNQLLEIIDKLYDWSAKAKRAVTLLAPEMVISHRDLDPKNVIWNLENPVIIDWEAAGYTNPRQELVETAIYWAEEETGNIDKDKFLAFLGGYIKKYGTGQGIWTMVLEAGFLGKLDWLEYNLKRSLEIECTDEEEQRLGTAEVTGTINALKRYSDLKSDLNSWLKTMYENLGD